MSKISPRRIAQGVSLILEDYLEVDRVLHYNKDLQGNIVGRVRSGNELLDFAIAPDNTLSLSTSSVRQDAYLEGYYLRDCNFLLLEDNSSTYRQGLLESAWRNDSRGKKCKTGKRCGDTCIAKDLECQGSRLTPASSKVAKKLRMAIASKSGANTALVAAASIGIGAGAVLAAQKLQGNPVASPSPQPIEPPISPEQNEPLNDQKSKARGILSRHKMAVAGLGLSTGTIAAALAVNKRIEDKEADEQTQKNKKMLEDLMEEANTPPTGSPKTSSSSKKTPPNDEKIEDPWDDDPEKYSGISDDDDDGEIDEQTRKNVEFLNDLINEAKERAKAVGDILDELKVDDYTKGVVQSSVARDNTTIDTLNEYSKTLSDAADYAKATQEENARRSDRDPATDEAISRLRDFIAQTESEATQIIDSTNALIKQERDRSATSDELTKFENEIKSGQRASDETNSFDRQLVGKDRVPTTPKGEVDLGATATILYESFQTGDESESQFKSQWNSKTQERMGRADRNTRQTLSSDYQKAVANQKTKIKKLVERLKTEPENIQIAGVSLLNLGDRKREALKQLQGQVKELLKTHSDRLKSYEQVASSINQDFQSKNKAVQEQLYQLALDRIDQISESVNSPKIANLRQKVEGIRSNPKLSKADIQAQARQIEQEITRLERQAVSRTLKKTEAQYLRAAKGLAAMLQYRSGNRNLSYESELDRQVNQLRSEKPFRKDSSLDEEVGGLGD